MTTGSQMMVHVNYETFKERFDKLLVEKLSIELEKIKPNARFSDLGVDSLDMAELIIEVEKEFDVTISDYEADQIVTVLDAETFIGKKLMIN